MKSNFESICDFLYYLLTFLVMGIAVSVIYQNRWELRYIWTRLTEAFGW